MPAVICDPKKRRTHRNRTLADLREMQRLAMDDIRSGLTLPHHRAQLMRAYDVLEERIRVMKMRPAPKPIDVPMPGRRKPKQAQSASAPMFEDPTKPQS